MGKRKEAKALRHKNDIDELISQHQENLKSIDEKLSSCEDISDASQKILELMEVNNAVTSMRYPFQKALEKIAEQHVRDDRMFRKSRYVYTEDKELKEQQLREKNPGIADTEKAISKKSIHIQKILDETTRNCHGKLAEVASSPFYPQAWKEHEPLRDLFAAAKAAREALGDNVPAVQQSKPAPAPSVKLPPVLRNNPPSQA